MPRLDRTGPLGQGPGTGRGFGWKRLNKTEERNMLKDEVGILEQELKAIKERLAELKGK